MGVNRDGGRAPVALPVFRARAEHLIEARSRQNYAEACQYLLEVRDLHERPGQGGEWRQYLAGLRREHRRLRAFQEELESAGL